ncbi:MAG: phenylalanine--tRNA ligase subunit beta [Oculatellaceae cyanobacterium Prado106]|jgi:phenylalanyl-tRNA synthetase beta chain|nr:phenylalanine--tRNA ligase subunit beta [Oculatellaceae cyanobacterium Prado106]
MPTTTFPLEYLSRLTAIAPQQLEQQAFNYGLDALLQGDALEVEVTAERPDLLAAEGFARAINIYNGASRSLPSALAPSDRTITVAPEVLPLRPFIGALIVEEVNLGTAGLEALIQFQEKVTQTFGRQRKKIAIGIYDLDRIQGNLHYRAAHQDELTFQPLGSDRTQQRPMTAREILTQHPSGLQYAHTIPAGDWVPVLQDDLGQVLSMPPIINAEGIGNIRDAASRPKARLLIDVTGTVAKAVLEMVNILAHNFLDLGAQVKTVTIVTPTEQTLTPDLQPRAIAYSARFLNEMVGTHIAKTDLGTHLSRMDLQTTGTDHVLVPTYRTDIFSQIDIAGDLMVAIGIDNLQPDIGVIQFYTGTADPLKQFAHQVSDWAQRMGLMEVKSFILTDPDRLRWFGDRYIQADNAKSRTYSATRTTLQAGLLEILSRNISAPKPINIYEIGEVLHLTNSGEVEETLFWGFASLDSRASFATAKAYLQTLLKALALPYHLTDCPETRYIPGRAATVWVGDRPIGHFGEIHPEILHAFSFPEPVCSGEIDCRNLWGVGSGEWGVGSGETLGHH